MKAWSRLHGPEYLAEAAGLGMFILTAGGFGVMVVPPAPLVAPLIGMLLAAELLRRFAARPVECAKLYHENPRRLILRRRDAR